MSSYGTALYGTADYTGPSETADYTLAIAFNEFIAGVFTLDSGLDGPDVLTDVDVYGGTFDDCTDDLFGDVVVTMGADQMLGSVQASSVTFSLSRPDDPSYWNPNNPLSPLNTVSPGFDVMRPVRYQADHDGTVYGVFTGFIRRATWRSDTRSCDIYCEDLLLRASRVYPVIGSTGPTTTGAAIDLLWDAVGYLGTRHTAVGDPLADFSADGSLSVTQILADLIEAERGTVYVNGDGEPVYESRDMAQSRLPAYTITVTDQAATAESSIDLDNSWTRAYVTGTGATYTAADEVSERRIGRGDLPEINNAYIPAGQEQALADDLVYEGVHGKPPISVTVYSVDVDTLQMILTAPLQTVFTLADSWGGTEGDGLTQRIVHTIRTGYHVAEYTLTKRTTSVFTLDSGLDGPDVFRY